MTVKVSYTYKMLKFYYLILLFSVFMVINQKPLVSYGLTFFIPPFFLCVLYFLSSHGHTSRHSSVIVTQGEYNRKQMCCAFFGLQLSKSD